MWRCISIQYCASPSVCVTLNCFVTVLRHRHQCDHPVCGFHCTYIFLYFSVLKNWRHWASQKCSYLKIPFVLKEIVKKGILSSNYKEMFCCFMVLSFFLRFESLLHGLLFHEWWVDREWLCHQVDSVLQLGKTSDMWFWYRLMVSDESEIILRPNSFNLFLGETKNPISNAPEQQSMLSYEDVEVK